MLFCFVFDFLSFYIQLESNEEEGITYKVPIYDPIPRSSFSEMLPEGGFSLDLRSADKELKTVSPEK